MISNEEILNFIEMKIKKIEGRMPNKYYSDECADCGRLSILRELKELINQK